MIIQNGRIVDTLVLVLLFSLSLYFIQRAKQGKKYKIQRLPAVDALEEGIGRSVEMGRPVHFTTGMTVLTTASQTGEKVLGYYIMEYLAELCASQRGKIIVSERDPLALGYIKEAVKLAYERGGWPEGFSEDMIVWWPWKSISYGLPNFFQEIKPGANYMLGGLAYSTVIAAESAALEGAFQVGYGQTQFLIASCEYVLIADEFYATSAYLSQDTLLVAGVTGNDYTKMVLSLLLILSLVIFNLGIKEVIQWLSM